jgi:MFS family permease
MLLDRHHGANKNPVVLELKQWGDLFKPKYIRRTTVALAIPFFQQFSGINAFVYYAPIFFAALGQDYEMSLILSGMVNICQFAAGIPTFLFLDKVGCRKLAIFGGIAMGIPHMIMAGIVSKYNNKWVENPGMGWFGVALICKYPCSETFLLLSNLLQISTFWLMPPLMVPWHGLSLQRFSPAPCEQRV